MKIIRDYVDADLAPLVSIARSDQANTGYPRSSLNIINWEDWLISGGESFAYVAENRGYPVGFISGSNVYKKFSNTEKLVQELKSKSGLQWMELKRLFVSLAVQGGGLGRALLDSGIIKAEELGYAPFVVVEPNGGLADWYVKCGGTVRVEFESVSDGETLFFIEFAG